MRFGFSALLLLFAPSLLASESISGLWFGTLSVGPKELRLAVRIETQPDGLTGTLDSLDQGSGERPLSELSFADGVLRFKTGSAAYEAKLADGKLTGTWLQRGLALPLELKRVDAIPLPRRPQEPVKPYPYDEEEVVVENAKAGVRLAGTLTLPRSAPPFRAVVLISGSGPQDRDETVFGHKPFLVLADALTRRGIAVLRVDDRGAGKSTGRREDATTDDYAGDVLACVEFLGKRKDIDRKGIGVVGHSEGGMIAPLVATRSSLVSFVVLLAAPGIPGEELVLLQAKLSLQAMGAHDKQVAAFEDLQRTILQLVKSTPEEKVLRVKLTELMKDAIAEAPESERAMFANPEQMVDAQMKRVSSPWYRWLLAFDPQPFLRNVNVPVLAVNGTKDVQVPAKENLAGIRAASPSAKIIEIANVNHLLQTAPTGAMSEYATIEETIAPAVLEVVGDWIVSLE